MDMRLLLRCARKTFSKKWQKNIRRNANQVAERNLKQSWIVSLDAIGCQFNTELTASCICTAVPMLCGLGYCSRTVVVDCNVNKAVALKLSDSQKKLLLI